MLGAIIGDIAGSKYEFNNITHTQFALLDEDCEFTDDTVCTVAVMDWLLHAPVRNSETATEYLRKWTRKYSRVGYGGNFRRWVLSDNPKPYGSYGNGAAMRISPVAWAAKDLDELKELSDIITGITHNHPEGLKGALVTATCVYLALHGYKKKDIESYLFSQYSEDSVLSKYYSKGCLEFDETCQGTVPIAIYCFLQSTDFIDCLKTTISKGGDSDTTAAISGAVAEAYYGIPAGLAFKALYLYLPPDLSEIIAEFSRTYGFSYGACPVKKGVDPYNISRFVFPQREILKVAIAELKNGGKRGHWMWCIFPKLREFAISDMEKEYSLTGIEEAKEFCSNPVISNNIRTICEELLKLDKGNGITEFFRGENIWELQASMTLLYVATGEELFKKVLDRYFDGKLDPKTLEVLKIENKNI